MIARACAHENEVTKVLRRGQWPSACAPELRAHVSACRLCGDFVLVAESFQRARTEAASASPVVSPGALWWRAHLRRRNAAMERISKPLLGAQIFALTINLVLVVAFLAYQARHGMGWLTWLEQFPASYDLHLDQLGRFALFNPGWSLAVLIPAAATLALLGGVVVYLASEKQ